MLEITKCSYCVVLLFATGKVYKMDQSDQNSAPTQATIFRWTEGRNAILLREVIVFEPFLYKVGSKDAGQQWSKIADKLNTYQLFKMHPRDQRSVREQFNKLMGDYKTKKASSERASGIEEDIPNEIDSLLEDILERSNSEPLRVDDSNAKKEEKKRKQGLACREKAMTTWSSNVDDDDEEVDSDEPGPAKKPRRSRKKSTDAFTFLAAKTERETNLRKEELELKRRELELQSQQLQQQQQVQQNTQNLILALIQKLSQ